MGSALLSTMTHFAPQIVSTDFADYLKDQSISENYSKYFSNTKTRVYHRHNPLYILHIDSLILKEHFSDEKRSNFKKFLFLPMTLAASTIKTVSLIPTVIPPSNPADAFSIKRNLPFEERECFVRPPGNFDFDKVMSKFTGIDAHYTPTTKANKLSKIFEEYILMHERRHCDQDERLSSHINESDADVYALKIVKEENKNNTNEMNELTEIILNLRVFNAISQKDSEHVSATEIKHGKSNFFDLYQDESSYKTTENMLENIVNNNLDALNDIKTDHEKLYFAAKALISLHKSPANNQQSDLLDTAQSYVHSVDYFNKMSDGKFLTSKQNPPLDLSYIMNSPPSFPSSP